MRRSGILMHITSLPGPGGIGTMGEEAYAFADFLKKAGMKIWQVLPVGPVGYGESPYQSTSTFAGNPMMISLPTLRREGLVDFEDAELYVPSREDQIEFAAVRENKEMILRRAFAQSGEKTRAEVEAFAAAHDWAEDYALFTAVKGHFDKAMWTKWPDKAIRLREPEAVKAYREQLDDEVRYQLFLQWIFFKQWFALKQYCNDRDISIFGDIPIYVAEDSADTWTHPEVFQLDKNRVPTRVAGVPPDVFSVDGQRWGNPLYNWTYLKKDGFTWWVERMRAVSTMYDIIRVDHFIGFANYYSIPYSCPTAREGKWVNAPGRELFKKLKAELPDMNVIAEDLGILTPRVKKLLEEVGYPGMKVLCFSFPDAETLAEEAARVKAEKAALAKAEAEAKAADSIEEKADEKTEEEADPAEKAVEAAAEEKEEEDAIKDDNPHSLNRMTENFVAYTGTHDNDTVLGWWATADELTRRSAMKALHFSNDSQVAGAFLHGLFKTPCDTAIIPMQDVLKLDGSARMNIPSTIGGNWSWRMLPGAIMPDIPLHLRILNKETGRL